MLLFILFRGRDEYSVALEILNYHYCKSKLHTLLFMKEIEVSNYNII